MEAERACELLGIDSGESKDEIEHAFRRVAKKAHPDSEDGDREAWDRLVEARDLLLARLPGADLIPSKVALEVARSQELTLDRLEKRREQATATEGELRSVVRRHTSRLDRRKRESWALGVIAGGLAAAVAVMRAVVLTGPNVDQNAFIAGLIAVLALGSGAAGLVGFMSRARVEHLTQAIEDVTNQLSRKAEYLRLLTEIKRVTDRTPPFESEALDEAIDEWSHLVGREEPESLAYTATRIGARDFARLFVAKGLELGVLKESTLEVDGELWVTYYVVDRDTAASGA